MVGWMDKPVPDVCARCGHSAPVSSSFGPVLWTTMESRPTDQTNPKDESRRQ